MDVREKLIKLIKNGVPCPDGRDPLGEYCDTCHYSESADCSNERLADYLISHGVTVQEWISVDDRLPDNKEYDWVLQVVENNGYMHIPRVMEYRQSKNDWFEETYGWLSNHNGLFTVTHWMPLPPPLKGE